MAGASSPSISRRNKAVDGFFEFTGERGARQPLYFKQRDDRVMAFARLWESWRGPKDAPSYEPLRSFTFATTALAARAPLQFPEVF